MKVAAKIFFTLALTLIIHDDCKVDGTKPWLRSKNRRAESTDECGYSSNPAGTFDLFYGKDQVKVGSVDVEFNDASLDVTYSLDPSSGCIIDSEDAVHVLLTGTPPTKNLAPGKFPCQASGSGTTSQSISCPVELFDFKCCALMVYVHAALVCGGEALETSYAGTPACEGLAKWCNVVELQPGCECGCDVAADTCVEKKTCADCGEVVCPDVTCETKAPCECGEDVCLSQESCLEKKTCVDCGEVVCPDVTCETKAPCECGDDVCLSQGSCPTKITCAVCEDEVCSQSECPATVNCDDCNGGTVELCGESCEPCDIPIVCETFLDCIGGAGTGRCADACTDGVCEFTPCANDCCKYTPGNDSGSICANGCGANQICIDSDTGNGQICADGPKIAICETTTPEFCLCLIGEVCTKSDCEDASEMCCNTKEESDRFDPGEVHC